MLRYWWFWTLVVSLIFGFATGLKFLSILILGSLSIVLVLNLVAVFEGIKKKGLEKTQAIGPAIITYICWWVLSKALGTTIAIFAVAISLGGLFLFCMYMKKEQ